MGADSFVERPTVQVLRVRADMKGGGPAEAMQRLESKLPSIRGRKFSGTFRILPEGEECFACVEESNSDDPVAMETHWIDRAALNSLSASEWVSLREC